jgi:hypothetical protein
MQISRHWRMNANRYRLEGVRYENGAVSLQERPIVQSETTQQAQVDAQVVTHNTTQKEALSAA